MQTITWICLLFPFLPFLFISCAALFSFLAITYLFSYGFSLGLISCISVYACVSSLNYIGVFYGMVSLAFTYQFSVIKCKKVTM